MVFSAGYLGENEVQRRSLHEEKCHKLKVSIENIKL